VPGAGLSWWVLVVPKTFEAIKNSEMVPKIEIMREMSEMAPGQWRICWYWTAHDCDFELNCLGRVEHELVTHGRGAR
jgi:hypothetical protein